MPSLADSVSSAFRRRPSGPLNLATARVRVGALSGKLAPACAYFVRSRAGDTEFECPGGPRPSAEADLAPKQDRPAACAFNHVYSAVPVGASGVVLEVRRAFLLPNGEQPPSELVGVVAARESAQGFAAYPVLASGACTGLQLSVAVEPVPVAVGTMTLQVDRLFHADKVAGATYFLQAGLPGAEQHAVPPAPGVPSESGGEALEDCRWRHVLSDVPTSAEGASVLLFRTSEASGSQQIGSFLVTQRTIGFVGFPVLGQDGKETGMMVRLSAPPGAAPPLRRSWLQRSFTARQTRARTGSFCFPPEQLAQIEEGPKATMKAAMAKIAEEPPKRRTTRSQPRQRPTGSSRRTSRRTRRTGGSVWSELPDSDDEQAEDWPAEAEPAAEWPAPQPRSRPAMEMDARDSSEACA